jgi:ParB/RepB/Spo0J family partition protein
MFRKMHPLLQACRRSGGCTPMNGLDTMEFRTVPLAAIDLEDETYRISLAGPDEPLRHSLRQAGMMHPLLLEEAEPESRYRIICGFRRAQGARQLGWDRLPVLILESDEGGPSERLLRNYHENRLRRELHVCEKARLVAKLRQWAGWSEQEIVDKLLPELQLPANLATLDRLLRIHKWPRDIAQAACQADLAAPPLLRLADLDAPDAALVVQLFCRFRWSHSRQKELLGYLLDLAAMRGAPPGTAALESLRLADLQDARAPLPQRAEALRQQLRRLRLPRLTAVEERYGGLRRALRLGPQITFEAPDDFEGDHYRVEFRFRSREQYLRALQQLQQAAEVPEFDDLIDLL